MFSRNHFLFDYGYCLCMQVRIEKFLHLGMLRLTIISSYSGFVLFCDWETILWKKNWLLVHLQLHSAWQTDDLPSELSSSSGRHIVTSSHTVTWTDWCRQFTVKPGHMGSSSTIDRINNFYSDSACLSAAYNYLQAAEFEEFFGIWVLFICRQLSSVLSHCC